MNLDVILAKCLTIDLPNDVLKGFQKLILIRHKIYLKTTLSYSPYFLY